MKTSLKNYPSQRFVQKTSIPASAKNVFLFLYTALAIISATALPAERKLVYSNSLNSAAAVDDWVMEGPGKLHFDHYGWMTMFSPQQQMHHVLWCPKDFPSNFIAQWQVQNLNPSAGLAIVFFAATGIQGETIFNKRLQRRDGTFMQYTEGDIRNYHISYYANAAHNPKRGHANLRKNPGFNLLQQGQLGIAASSTDIHTVELEKRGSHIRLLVDGRVTIDYKDTAMPWQGGKIGFRQMQWTQFRYRNFKVWQLEPQPQ